MEAIGRSQPSSFYTSTDRLHGVHLLLSAAMIAKRLADLPRRLATDDTLQQDTPHSSSVASIPLPSSSSGGPLCLDDDGRVWIGQRRIHVPAGQELDLLRCLYKREGQILSHQEIADLVFKELYPAGDPKKRISTLVWRLRRDIEPDLDTPRYILTVRGKGYRLQVDGVPDT